MRLEPGDHEFITRDLPTVDGWLIDDAAVLTAALLRWQAAAGVGGGGIVEIGVFAGRYLSLLYHLTQATGEPVLGLDTFQWCPRETAVGHLARLFGPTDRLTLQAADSTLLKPVDLVGPLAGRPRFISVDGAHTAVAVLSDLTLAEAVLADGGIVAVDDILNPRAIGVSEGAYRYFLTRGDRGLVPFAYSGNKLFVARGSYVDRCHAAAWQFARDNPGLKVADEFNRLLGQGRDWVEQQLFGRPVLIF